MSSLGPSDSASQQSQFNATFANTIKQLIESVEAPYMQPEFLEVTILWYLNDCETDKMEGNIITKTNPLWPKMHLAIHHADGINITKSEYNAIHAYVKMIIQNLMDLACSSLDPHLSNSKLPT